MKHKRITISIDDQDKERIQAIQKHYGAIGMSEAIRQVIYREYNKLQQKSAEH